MRLVDIDLLPRVIIGAGGEFMQGVQYMREMLNLLPTVEVPEVRHERFEWGDRNGQYGIWCTGCGAGWTDSENASWIAHEHDYCPKCGAKMDGKGDEA